MRSIYMVAIFLILTPLTLGISLISLISLHEFEKDGAVKPQEATFLEVPRPGVQVYASLPTKSFPEVAGAIDVADGRSEIVRNYLDKYSSPLGPYAQNFVDSADRYGVDYRLVVAIAQQESNLCKIYPKTTYNCWGWGIHSEGTLGFDSFPEGIETVTRGLREEYLNKGYGTIEDIMSKYTPLSNGSWARGVLQFMGEIETIE